MPLAESLSHFPSQCGETLDALSDGAPLLVVFLRHGGCPFCREVLAELSDQRGEIEQAGAKIALVHLMTDGEAAALFRRYGLDDVPRFADPEGRLYEAFGLPRGSIAQVMGPRVWGRGLKSTLAGHLPGVPRGDVFRLPGTFLLAKGEILRADRPEASAGHPDFAEFAQPAPQ
jgi:hypothetical protein